MFSGMARAKENGNNVYFKVVSGIHVNRTITNGVLLLADHLP